MSAAGGLSEPQVLAHTKRHLFPANRQDSYAVVDTQFASEEWRPGQRVDAAVHETLAPFNHVRVGGGYPDLVAVQRLPTELLAVQRVGVDTDPPLIAIEAKGVASGSVDTERGIIQAYDRLAEANVAYVAVPASAVGETDRTLANELNVGVLGVDPGGSVEALVQPRVVGNRTSDDATAIRFQASAQGVADQSFGLNHPKNYLGYPLAHYADGETEARVERQVVGAVDDARRGAAFLGLIDDGPSGVDLTELGREVIRFALARYGSASNALAEFEAWQGTRQRFYDEAPLWGELVRRVVFAYPATQLLVAELHQLHADGFPSPTLVDFVEWLHVKHPTFTIELFVRGDDGVRSQVLTADGELQSVPLHEGGTYHSPTVFQLKAMLYHAGILTERGNEPSELDPDEDVWRLREPV